MFQTLEFHLNGSAKDPTLVMIHGWPDGPEVWRHQVQALAKHYQCLRVTLPNFGKSPEMDDGLDFPELVQILALTIDKALQKQKPRKLILMGHDWGAYLCYLFERRFPERVERMVTMEVGAQIETDSLLEAVADFSYQGWLISAWAVGKFWPQLGTEMSRRFALWAQAPLASKTTARMNYLYFYFWKDLLLKSRRSTLLQDYEPRCPLLFLYGENKPLMFHSQKWLRTLQRRRDCQVIGIPRAGHWLMLDQPKLTNQWIEKWLALNPQKNLTPPRNAEL